ncbi:MAG: hypothetical protein HY735_01380 [Verrucomicrobia bacterium]|nr:hypothetical protein [Verrucomicrobiota bacterium]
MNSEEQLFQAYEAVFRALFGGLIVVVVLVFVAAIVLIVLCCRQLKAQNRQRDAEAKAAIETCLRSSEKGSDPVEDECSTNRLVRIQQM